MVKQVAKPKAPKGGLVDAEKVAKKKKAEKHAAETDNDSRAAKGSQSQVQKKPSAKKSSQQKAEEMKWSKWSPVKAEPQEIDALGVGAEGGGGDGGDDDPTGASSAASDASCLLSPQQRYVWDKAVQNFPCAGGLPSKVMQEWRMMKDATKFARAKFISMYVPRSCSWDHEVKLKALGQSESL